MRAPAQPRVNFYVQVNPETDECRRRLQVGPVTQLLVSWLKRSKNLSRIL
jgi:hypothetical protein